jgi:hypothetical protein
LDIAVKVYIMFNWHDTRSYGGTSSA